MVFLSLWLSQTFLHQLLNETFLVTNATDESFLSLIFHTQKHIKSHKLHTHTHKFFESRGAWRIALWNFIFSGEIKAHFP